MSDSAVAREREPFVPFAERSSWGRRFFDLTVGEALSKLSYALYDAHCALDRAVGRLAKAGWVA
jgi:hypothetical protein